MTNSTKPYDEKSVRMAYLVGTALTRFSSIEMALLLHFGHALRISPIVAAKLLALVKSFSIILNMTDVAVRGNLRGRDELKYWQSLVEYVRELSTDRNHIAHTGVVMHGPSDKGGEPIWDKAEPKLGPSTATWLIGTHKIEPMDIGEVDELWKDFQEASEMLMDFLGWMQAGSQPSIPKYSVPVSRRRHPRTERRAAGQKAPKPRRKPSPPWVPPEGDDS